MALTGEDMRQVSKAYGWIVGVLLLNHRSRFACLWEPNMPLSFQRFRPTMGRAKTV